MKQGKLMHFMVDLEACMTMTSRQSNNLAHMETLITEMSNIIMMKEEALDITPKKIQDLEVSREIPSALRLLMTGFVMKDLVTAGSHLESPRYKTDHLTKGRTWKGPVLP